MSTRNEKEVQKKSDILKLHCGPGLANPPLLVEYKIIIFASMGYIIVSYSIHINKNLAKLMLKEGPPSPAGGLATPQ